MKSLKELRNIAAILSDEIVSVQCSFETEQTGKSYTFLATYTLAQTLRKDDLVVAHTNNMSKPVAVLRVVEVDRSCLLDCPDRYVYCWLVQKVNVVELDRLNSWSDAAGEQLYEAQRSRAQQAMLAELGISGSMLPALSAPMADDVVESYDEV